MKSTDKFVLVLVASLALLLAGCGGGGSSNTGDDMDMDMSGPQKTALMNAHTALQGAVNALVGEATQDEVNTAKTAATALQNAINAATDVAASDLTMYRNALTNANNAIGTAQNLLTTQGNKEMTAMAKALKKAIDTPATSDGTAVITVTPTSIPAIDLDGAGAGTATSTALTLKKGASVGSHAGWSGTDYAGEAGTGTAKTTGMVRVYSNQEAATPGVAFTHRSNPSGLTAPTSDTSNAYGLGTAADSNIKSDNFPTAGQETYTGTDRKFSGTYMGASGTYECTSTGDCTATPDTDGVITLAGTWTFTPSPDATIQQSDANYLQFGWWVRKDKDGPTHAGVFYRSSAAALTAVNNTAAATLVGKATYTGGAAGKFAISNPLHPAGDNSGHFTADAKLEADFQASGSFLSGTINNFRLNDGSADPGWSVSLQKNATAISDGAFAGPANTGTVWSIGDVETAASGDWEARLYNDKMEDDGNTVPDSVAGSFESSISTTHSLIGAFGAEKD